MQLTTYTNTASTVTFEFGDRRGVLVSCNGKPQFLSPRQTEDFEEALVEAGYRLVEVVS